MNFLNAPLLVGAVLGVVPLVIHLLHRKRFRTQPWGAMHLLEAVLRTHRRRMRLEQFLLLLLRVCIPLLLALAMARPVWNSPKGGGGDNRASLLVLLDNSYSMQAGSAGKTSFDAARDEVARIAAALPRGSQMQVLLMGDSGGPLSERPTYDCRRLTESLANVLPCSGVAQLPAALERAAGLLEKMREPVRRVVIFTDFQRVSFSAAEMPDFKRSMDRLRSMKPSPEVTFFDVGREMKGNVAVDALEFPMGIVGVGQRVEFRATLRNYGESPYNELPVVFRVDGQEKAASRVSLAPGQSSQLVFSHSFEGAGSHFVDVFSDADSVAPDNRFTVCIHVRGRIPVVLVNGEAVSDPLRGETDFAEIALQPFSAGRLEMADLLSARVVTPEKLSAATLLDSAVVVLANVPKLSDRQFNLLEGFVSQGGGLMVWPGARLDLDWYRSVFFHEGKGLLPALFGPVQGDLREGGKVAAVATQHFESPALAFFNDPRNGSLSDASIRVWHRLLPGPLGTEPFEVYARLDNGDPFLVGRRVGGGRVLSAATSIDADWCNLPMRPVYVPLLQRLVLDLASTGEAPRNLSPGQVLSAAFPTADTGTRLRLELPDQSSLQLPVVSKGGRAMVEFDGTQRPGLYTLFPQGREPIYFAVNVERKESDLQRLTSGEIEKLGGESGVLVVKNGDEYQKRSRERQVGRELWRLFLCGTLFCLFAELFFQQWVTGVGRRRANLPGDRRAMGGAV
jgi:hypothetical protein